MLQAGLRELNLLYKVGVRDGSNEPLPPNDEQPFKFVNYVLEDLFLTNLDAPRGCHRSILSCASYAHNDRQVVAHGRLRGSQCAPESMSVCWDDARCRIGLKTPLHVFGRDDHKIGWMGYSRFAGIRVTLYQPLKRKLLMYVKRGKYVPPGTTELSFPGFITEPDPCQNEEIATLVPEVGGRSVLRWHLRGAVLWLVPGHGRFVQEKDTHV